MCKQSCECVAVYRLRVNVYYVRFDSSNIYLSMNQRRAETEMTSKEAGEKRSSCIVVQKQPSKEKSRLVGVNKYIMPDVHKLSHLQNNKQQKLLLQYSLIVSYMRLYLCCLDNY